MTENTNIVGHKYSTCIVLCMNSCKKGSFPNLGNTESQTTKTKLPTAHFKVKKAFHIAVDALGTSHFWSRGQNKIYI